MTTPKKPQYDSTPLYVLHTAPTNRNFSTTQKITLLKLLKLHCSKLLFLNSPKDADHFDDT
jgi:hypothetical protein